MKEHSLQPGDQVGKWIVDRHIANGCIYAVHEPGDDTTRALKLREPNNNWRFRKELSALKKIQAAGGHPSFQRLYDYDEEALWMVITYAPPERSVEYLVNNHVRHPDLLKAVDLKTLFDKIRDAYLFAASIGLYVNRHDVEVFLFDNSTPFFIDMEGSENAHDPMKIEALRQVAAARRDDNLGLWHTINHLYRMIDEGIVK